MIDHVVVDVEIQRTIEEVGGWDATEKMGVAVACVWDYRTARMRVYGPEDVLALRERLLKADRISGYNIFNFDFPVIWGIAKPDWLASSPKDAAAKPDYAALKTMLRPKTDDVLRRIWQAQGFDPDKWQPGMGGTKLDDVAGTTLGSRKIGEGAMAPVWYQKGLVQRVCNYCADDVAIERDLTDFVDRYGYVLLRSKTNSLEYHKLVIPPWSGA